MESGSDPSVFEDRFLFRLGLFAHDRAKLVLALGLTLTLGLASMMVFVEPDWAESFGEGDLESSEVFGVLGSDFGDPDAENTESFQLLIHHPGLDANDSAVTNLVDHILEPIESEATVTVLRAWEADAANRSTYVSADGEWSRSQVNVTLGRTEAKSLLKEHWKAMEERIEDRGAHIDDEGDITAYLTGNLAIDATFDLRLKNDLLTSELASGPLVAAVLLIVFGSLVAAILPLGIGVLTVISAMGVTIWLSTLEGANVNNFAGNIITLLGLGVSIDYSLFVVYRYREERSNGHDTRGPCHHVGHSWSSRLLLGIDRGDRTDRHALLRQYGSALPWHWRDARRHSGDADLGHHAPCVPRTPRGEGERPPSPIRHA